MSITCYRPHPKDDGRLCFHRCVSVKLSRGYPHPADGGGGRYPIQLTGGTYPIPGSDRGCMPIPGLDRGGTPGHPHLGQVPGQGGGNPHCRCGQRGIPLSGQVPGVPPCPGLDGGTSLSRTGCVPPPVGRQSSIASICYVTGGMPLAFTQEDFLVSYCFV